MTDIEQPLEEPEEPPAEETAPEPEPAPEEPETPTEAPEETVTVWVALTRVRYEDSEGNEFFCGPGEVIPDEYVAQLETDSVSQG